MASTQLAWRNRHHGDRRRHGHRVVIGGRVVSRLDDALREVQDELRKERERLDFWRLQIEVGQWATANFGAERPAWHQILGATEEVGELAHAYLKREQGIRGTREEHTNAIRDAVADIIVYLADFACNEDFNLQEVVEQTWERVKARNWTANKLHGGDVASHRELHPQETSFTISRATVSEIDRELRQQTHGIVGWDLEHDSERLPEDLDTFRITMDGLQKMARHGLAISDTGTVIDMNKIEEQRAKEAEREALGEPVTAAIPDEDIPF